jgi:energy-coupling factor transport system substrate-specific component
MQPVSYTNLSGGKYTFHLSVINTMTGDEENAVSITLIKEKAIYERGWFWVCILIVDLLILWGCVALYTRRKTAKLLEKQEENNIYIKQIIQAFAKTIDFKDKYTKGHSFRVAKYAGMIAKQMGYDETEATKVHHIGLLHDVGKITIPDEILNKPGKLSDEEYEIIKQHAANGYDILKEIEIMPELALGAGYHHERIDGNGYPSQKAGEEIPQIAQIIAVADTFDAMNSTRPYRKKMKMEDIRQELIRVSGTQLNAEIVQALLDLIDAGALEDEC